MLTTLKKITPEILKEIEKEKKLRQTDEIFLLFSLGSQFDHLIKQELGKLGVFCLVADPSEATADDVKKVKPIGIVLSGGPASVHAEPPKFDEKIFDLNIPILGICLGFQMWASHLGAKVNTAVKREFGTHRLTILDAKSLLFQKCSNPTLVMESHGDYIEPNKKFDILAETENAPVAAGWHQHLWGVQFHPEVTETIDGPRIFANFCFKICRAKNKYPAEAMAQRKISQLKQQIGNKKVLLALSGGSDSVTVAYLLKQALKKKKGQLRAVYIKGIDRPDDEADVKKYFSRQDWLELKIVDATDEFLKVLQGQIIMADKRLAMRRVYKTVLETEAEKFNAGFIVQGTLYTDISEAGGGYQTGARKAQIKLHHNVDLKFSLAELTPLDDCVKDSGRNIGRTLGVPEELLVRHPFPGPGLVVRIEGEVEAEKLAIARQVDGIYIEELRAHNLYSTVWQAGAVVTQSETTCTKGDDAASGYIVALWAVWSVNGFTARAAELPYDFLKKVSRRITNEIRQVGSVVYRLSDKPPATIEWG